MDEVVEMLGPRKAVRLAVSVPFHSSMLTEASKGFAEVLAETEIRDPAFPIVCNVDAAPVRNAAEVRDALARQFANSVRWQESVEWMLNDAGVRSFVECGPKPTLTKMVGQIASPLGIDDLETASVCDRAGLEALQS